MIFYEILLFYAFFMKNMKISNFYVFLWFYDSCDAWNFISIHCWNQEKMSINLVLAQAVQGEIIRDVTDKIMDKRYYLKWGEFQTSIFFAQKTMN